MRWKSNKVVSLKLRNNKYVLIQFSNRKNQITVFNIFRDSDSWNDIKLINIPILFNITVSKGFLQRSNMYSHNDIEPLNNIIFSNSWISVGHGFRTIKLWENTINEKEVLITGTGQNLLVLEDEVTRRAQYTPISIEDYEKFSHLELNNLRIYPELNERLNLCSELNQNFDPLKELAFNRELDLSCKTYIDIIAGKTSLNELGY